MVTLLQCVSHSLLIRRLADGVLSLTHLLDFQRVPLLRKSPGIFHYILTETLNYYML